MKSVLDQYYQAFNSGNYEGMLALLSEDVVHEPSQGEPRKGKALFREFLQHMERCYKEQVLDPVILVSADGSSTSYGKSGSLIGTGATNCLVLV